MTGLHDADGGWRCGGLVGRLAVAVLCYGQPAADAVLEYGFDGAAHRRGGLAGSDDEDAAVAAQVVGQRGRGRVGGGVGDGQDLALTLKDVLHGGEGIDCIERGVEDGQDGAAVGWVGLEEGSVEAGHPVFFRFSGKNRFSSSTRI